MDKNNSSTFLKKSIKFQLNVKNRTLLYLRTLLLAKRTTDVIIFSKLPPTKITREKVYYLKKGKKLQEIECVI